MRERNRYSIQFQRDSTQVDVVFVKAFSTLKRKLQCVHDKNDTKGRVQNTNKVQRFGCSRSICDSPLSMSELKEKRI